MKIEFNYFWGLLGFMGVLGYVLENPVYYAFFAFFLLFLVPVFNEKELEKNSDVKKSISSSSYDLHKLSMWIASAALLICGLVLIIWKTIDDTIALIIFLSIIILSSNYFQSIGMDKPKDERLRKIGTMAATWSWYTTLSFVGFLLVFSSWGGREYNAAEAFGVTIFVMVLTMLVSSAYFNYKGDAE